MTHHTHTIQILTVTVITVILFVSCSGAEGRAARSTAAAATCKTTMDQDGECCAPPVSYGDIGDWWAANRMWAEDVLSEIQYTGEVFKYESLNFTKRQWAQPQVMVHDSLLYDTQTQSWTADRFLSDLSARYGGIDGLLLWHSYPNIGVDTRSQFDMLRDLPDVQSLVSQLHDAGVSVLLPYNPWDTDDVELAQMIRAIGADGFNGDTMHGVPENFFDACIAEGWPCAVEPEEGVGHNLTVLTTTPLSWNYCPIDSVMPCVSRYRVMEPRFNHLPCHRWQQDKTDMLQNGWFLGSGVVTWENVWSIWIGLTDRNAHAVEAMGSIMRFVNPLDDGWIWTPYIKNVENQFNAAVYASKFKHSEKGYEFYALINRNATANSTGPQLVVDMDSDRDADSTFYDVWHGVELHPESHPDTQTRTLSFDIESRGFGAVFVTKSGVDPPQGFAAFLNTMAQLNQRSLGSYSNEFHVLPQSMVDDEAEAMTGMGTGTGTGTIGSVEIDMDLIQISAVSNYTFTTSGTEIEGGDGPGVDVQFPWEEFPIRIHRRVMDIPDFKISKTPVTNKQFSQFVNQTSYRPSGYNEHRFLKHWGWPVSKTPPMEIENKPAVFVSRTDASAFCRALGGRLPKPWEHQVAASGGDESRKYPWGDGHSWRDDCHTPFYEGTGPIPPPADVDSFPSDCCSASGLCYAMANVWEWSSEFADTHSRCSILLGGSYYMPQGSSWYFPAAYDLHAHSKLIMFAPGMDRAETVGFRCVIA